MINPLATVKPSRDGMISSILNRGLCFYHKKEANGLQLVERRTTSILLQPNDFWLFGKLDNKISEATEWPLSSFDFPVINQLSKMRTDESSHDKMYVVLALYMYLADLVTIYPNQDGITFLEACRRSGFLEYNDTPIKTKFINALQKLDLYKHWYVQELVNDWEQTGRFKVTGLPAFDRPTATDINSQDTPIESRGVYSVLARTLAQNKPEGEFSPVMLMNNCIAYVQYVKDCFQHLETEQDRLDEVLRHASICSKNPQLALDTAKKGHQLRKSKLKDEATNYRDILIRNYDKDTEHSFFREIFFGLSDDVVSVYHHIGIEIVYSEEFGLRKVYPQRNLPGYDDNTTETSRNSKGLNLSRFKVAMFSNDELDVNLPPAEKFTKLLHTISHEAFHIVSGSNGVLDLDLSQQMQELAERRNKIFNKAPLIFAKLASVTSDNISSLIDIHMRSTGFTFRQIIDIHYYKNYHKDAMTEEMLCNLYGLSQVELANNNFIHPLNSSEPALQEIQQLAKEMQSYVKGVANVIWQSKQTETFRQAILR